MLKTPRYEQCEADFNLEWSKMEHVYGSMLGAKTLKLVKLMAKTLYIDGRVAGQRDVLLSTERRPL